MFPIESIQFEVMSDVENDPRSEGSSDLEPRASIFSRLDSASLPPPPPPPIEEPPGHGDIETQTSTTSERAANNANNIGVGGSSTNLPAGNASNEPEPEVSFYQLAHATFMLVIYFVFVLIVMLLTVLGVLVVLVFCVFPTIILISLVLCINYCAGNEHVPLWNLVRYILRGEDPDLNPTPEKARANRALYGPKLIVRKLLSIADRAKNDEIDDIPSATNHRLAFRHIKEKHQFIIVDEHQSQENIKTKTVQRKTKLPIEFRTESKSLLFSAPLEETSKDSNEAQREDKESRSANEAIDIRSGDAEDADTNEHSDSGTIDGTGSGLVRQSIRDDPTSPDDRKFPSEESQDWSVVDDSFHRGANTAIQDGIELTPINRVTKNEGCSDVYENDSENGGCENDSCENGGENACSRNCKCSVKIRGCSIPSPEEEITSEEFLSSIVDDSQDRDITCDICMLEFAVGDEIAWSPNVNCNHAFHKECILEWYERQMCRMTFDLG